MVSTLSTQPHELKWHWVCPSLVEQGDFNVWSRFETHHYRRHSDIFNILIHLLRHTEPSRHARAQVWSLRGAKKHAKASPGQGISNRTALRLIVRLERVCMCVQMSVAGCWGRLTTQQWRFLLNVLCSPHTHESNWTFIRPEAFLQDKVAQVVLFFQVIPLAWSDMIWIRNILVCISANGNETEHRMFWVPWNQVNRVSFFGGGLAFI